VPLDKTAVAARLREFGIRKFGTIRRFANALDLRQSNLSSNYLSGRSLPGAEILIKLDELGCDIVWLLTGRLTAMSLLKGRILELEAQLNSYDDRWKKHTEELRRVAENITEYKKGKEK
jgi:hypothetical protein